MAEYQEECMSLQHQIYEHRLKVEPHTASTNSLPIQQQVTNINMLAMNDKEAQEQIKVMELELKKLRG